MRSLVEGLGAVPGGPPPPRHRDEPQGHQPPAHALHVEEYVARWRGFLVPTGRARTTRLREHLGGARAFMMQP